MKIGFDLDGTLDRPGIRNLALALLAGGHELFVISGSFPESGHWQEIGAKRDKLSRLGIIEGPRLKLHVLNAVPETYDRAYRLADLGLRKGELISQLGIEIMFDDSEDYIKMMPKMCGAQMVQVMP